MLRLPLLSRGQWGDDHAPESILDLSPNVDVLIVPQANLVGKASSSSSGSSASSIRYNEQADKDLARRLYSEFCQEISIAAAKALAPPPAKTKEEVGQDIMEKQRRNALHPKHMFQPGGEFGESGYSKFDDRGVPTHDADGNALAKSAKKKCEKLFKARMQKYEKALARKKDDDEEESKDDTTATTAVSTMESKSDLSEQQKNVDVTTEIPLPRVLCGVFGNRQGFRCVSSGPTIHCLDL